MHFGATVSAIIIYLDATNVNAPRSSKQGPSAIWTACVKKKYLTYVVVSRRARSVYYYGDRAYSKIADFF